MISLVQGLFCCLFYIFTIFSNYHYFLILLYVILHKAFNDFRGRLIFLIT